MRCTLLGIDRDDPIEPLCQQRQIRLPHLLDHIGIVAAEFANFIQGDAALTRDIDLIE